MAQRQHIFIKKRRGIAIGHRTLKRVCLDFQGPLGKVWEGYINPYPGPFSCNLCDGSGYNTATKQIADEVNAYQHRGGLDEHDAINRFILIKARAKRLGIFGKCRVCNGEGTLPHPNETIQKLHEEWKKYEPPTGTGYQLWETCSEGSPVSPVFARAEELADWCAENATIFASEKTSRANWLKMFVGEEDLDTGSLLVIQPGFIGAMANAPE